MRYLNMTLTEILEAKKRDELIAMAKALKITKYSSMKKAELTEAIEKAVHIKKTFKPNPERQEYYKKKYERFKKLYELMHLF